MPAPELPDLEDQVVFKRGLDGSLVSVPRQSEGGLPPLGRLGLYDLPVDTWRGYGGPSTWGHPLAESERNMRHFYRPVWDTPAPSSRS